MTGLCGCWYGLGMAEKDTDQTALWSIFEGHIRDQLQDVAASEASPVNRSKALVALARAWAIVQSEGEHDPQVAEATELPQLTAADMAHLPDITPPGSTGSTE